MAPWLDNLPPWAQILLITAIFVGFLYTIDWFFNLITPPPKKPRKRK